MRILLSATSATSAVKMPALQNTVIITHIFKCFFRQERYIRFLIFSSFHLIFPSACTRPFSSDTDLLTGFEQIKMGKTGSFLIIRHIFFLGRKRVRMDKKPIYLYVLKLP